MMCVFTFMMDSAQFTPLVSICVLFYALRCEFDSENFFMTFSSSSFMLLM